MLGLLRATEPLRVNSDGSVEFVEVTEVNLQSTKKKKNKSIKFLESITKPVFISGEPLESIRLGEEETQANFAEKLGISRSHLCDIEREENQ